MFFYLFTPIVSLISAVPFYFYITGRAYSDSATIKKIFKNFVWVYSKIEIGLDNTKKYINDDDYTKNKLELESVIKMEDYNFYEYKLRHNEKNYYITLINSQNDIQDKIHECKLNILKQNIEKKINNKNLIVHCSLVNKDDDIVLDVTNDFRKFKFYYDEHKQDEYTLYLKYFFEYLKMKYTELDLTDLSLMIYKNDEQFTELRHSIENLYAKTFFEILNNSENHMETEV